MEITVKAENCRIKVKGYFHEYYLQFDKGDVLEISVQEQKEGEDGERG